MYMHEFENLELVINVGRIVIVGTITFIVAFGMTPLLTHYLYKYHFGKNIRATGQTPIYSKLHAGKAGTPVGGGIIVWGSVVIMAGFFWLIHIIWPSWITTQLNFLSRAQTLLPLGALLGSAMVGLVDDYLNVKKIGPAGGGLNMKHRLLLYTAVAAIGAWWFYFKLNWSVLHVPYFGDYEIGLWYIPLFLFVIVATAFSVNESDGLDGLAGGILLFCYSAYAALSFGMERMELAVFCSAIGGGLLAFLWFNVHPARFFMGDTGAMSLGTTLGIIAMLTNSALVLPIIAFPLVLESASVIIQVASKKWRGKKVFLSAPLHHHFEAVGWPETKVTMRFWIIAAVSAAIGLLVGLLGM
ncbi:MAG TPA: phospho-N-acetylmuramoyl-pentapeptide-transferase [Candidatus Andersenbacteria bacterium]|nr:MAG: Phospho-N-acetylmuramoyl-pentapeptide-transferase [Parcubacteria group bacterium GW2011_GWA2_45_14]OGY33717.1 MAG: phospho-N-acetylmuramoyl-pentapeptide-transferase [Candidatus Andersenbacteria bacterium RIFCSPHIGHO2_02_FULL_46_16]OGY36151.1 MAG: phospho-N-acetylmuramoyl-pentapeptide-transferase [Candidatus Andersenbacteria bacterium RIFCSPLOWO2_02_FULL_46_11]HBE89801.1 phospho-N-acetylmuramoyl-pentapeptide-transferase [Candidatus Andersenbacteria bacterium]